ncbi:MAG: hypothetical protein ABEJ81_02585 [Haloferacaceae archaeon]
MSAFEPSSDGPTTEQAFQNDLARLIRVAHANGVDVEGGWEDRTLDADAPDWGIEIYEVSKPR